jgi:hypothetical protein
MGAAAFGPSNRNGRMNILFQLQPQKKDRNKVRWKEKNEEKGRKSPSLDTPAKVLYAITPPYLDNVTSSFYYPKKRHHKFSNEEQIL